MLQRERLTVSFVVPSLGEGGAERVVANLANQFARDGYGVNVYTILNGDEAYEILPEVNHQHADIREKNKLFRILKRFWWLRNQLKNDKSTTIIAFDRYYGICAALGNGKKVIGSERNDPYSNMPKVSFQKYFRDILYNLVDCVVFQTDYAQHYFDKKIQKHSVIIPNPISVEILPKVVANRQKNEIYAACRLTTQKNLPMLLKAFAQFSAKHPKHHMTIYGEGPLKNEITQLINQLGVNDKVDLAGYVKTLPQRVKDAGMYVSSSDYEGISNTMLEALAMGIPSICTDCPAGGARLCIQDKVNGMLVPVGDQHAMYEAMCALAENPQLADSLSREAVKIREIFHVEKIAAMWEALFE